MMNDHNDNIIGAFFKAVAALWNNAAKYQTFIILAAIALLAIVPFFGESLSSETNVVLNIIIFCAIAAGGFLLFRLKGSNLAAFTFAATLLLRICLIFLFEQPTSYMSEDVRKKDFPWIRYHNSTLLQADEYLYVYYAQTYKNITIGESLSSVEFSDHTHRTSFLISRLFRWFGDEFVWSRIIGSLLGALAAAITTLAAEKLFNIRIATIISLLSVAAPQTAFYSVRFLKEIWVIFAVSLIVFGFTVIIRNKKAFWAVLPIALSAVILFWFRFEYCLISIAAIPIAIFFRKSAGAAGKTVIVISIILLALIISFYQFNQLTYKATSMLDKYTRIERGQRGNIETVAILDKIYKSHRPLRLLNIPLLVLNPPPKRILNIIVPENGLYDIVLQADIWQWWLGLPFLIIGTVVIITKRVKFLVFLLPYIVAMSTSALLLGGLQPNILRYRDSLAPMAFIIIGVGIESLVKEKKPWKNMIILSAYSLFVLLAIYLYAKGF